tara:strand:+ start:695 stop:1504 length:810 start_codon:yes stop_codon:yes gene_type:complete
MDESNLKTNFFKGYKDSLSIAKIKHNSHELSFCGSNEINIWRVKTIYSKEKSTIKWLDRLKETDLLLDVGANIGLYTIYAAVTRNCNVISVEPESQNFSTLVKNIIINNMNKQITPYCCALSNENNAGILHLSELVIDGGVSGHMFNEEVSFDLSPNQGKFAFKQGCIGLTLDNAIRNGSFEVPDFIKIDVDGFEHKVIEGSIKTLKNPKVRSILIELYTKLDQHKKIIDLLVSLGFKYDPTQAENDRKKKGWNEGMGNYIFDRSNGID